MPKRHNPILNGRNGNGDFFYAWAFRGLLFMVLSASGFLLQRVVTLSDDVVATVHQHDVALHEIKDRLTEMIGDYKDHESRLRALERGKR